jgi:hypothetical protein
MVPQSSELGWLYLCRISPCRPIRRSSANCRPGGNRIAKAPLVPASLCAANVPAERPVPYESIAYVLNVFTPTGKRITAQHEHALAHHALIENLEPHERGGGILIQARPILPGCLLRRGVSRQRATHPLHSASAITTITISQGQKRFILYRLLYSANGSTTPLAVAASVPLLYRVPLVLLAFRLDE